MRELNTKEIKNVNGGIIHYFGGWIFGYALSYGLSNTESQGRWLYNNGAIRRSMP